MGGRIIRCAMTDCACHLRIETMRTLIGLWLVLSLGSSSIAGPLPRRNEERDLREEDRKRPAILYNRTPTAACFADYVPSAAEVAAPFVVNMAQNEYEPMQVAMYVPSGSPCLQNVRIKIRCDIAHKIGHLYYQPRKELDWIGDLEVDRGQPWEGKRDVLPQCILPKDSIEAIEPRRNGVFWVTFQTDATPPGVYRGDMDLYASSELLTSVPFLIRVYAFALPRPQKTYGLYYFPYRTDPRFQGRDFLKLYLEDMAAHGMNTMMTTVDYAALAISDYNEASTTPHQEAWYSSSSRLYCSNYMDPEDYDRDGGYNVIRFVDAQVNAGRRAGLIQRDQPLITQPSAFETENKWIATTALRRWAVERGWPDFVLYMRDEPGPTVFASVSDHVRQWKCAGAKTTSAMSLLAAFALGHLHDVWIVHAGYITPELLREAKRIGARVSTYNFSLRITNVEAGRYYAGLYTWSLGLAGNVTYNYMWLPSTGPGLRKQSYFHSNWKLSKPANLGHVLPSPVGPIPGVGFEGRREGVDDVRYLQLLEARLAAADANDPVAGAAERWLDQLRAESPSDGFLPTHSFSADWMDPHPGFAASDYDSIRARAAVFIQQLPPAPGEENDEPATAQLLDPIQLESIVFEKARLQECIAALRSGTIKEKRQAASALALRDPMIASSALAALVELLEDPAARVVALRALAHLGSAAVLALPQLERLLDCEDAFIRVGATYVLTRIGPPAASVLRKCQYDINRSIVHLANETLTTWK